MNERLKTVMTVRYKAIIEDSKYKIKCYSDQEIIIPEHPDITLEIDKLLEAISCACDKIRVIDKYYPDEDDIPF